MKCDCCEKAKSGNAYPVHCPSCAYCGARLIWRIQRFRISRDDKVKRCRNALEHWLKYGHNEEQIRRLAKQEAIPLEP